MLSVIIPIYNMAEFVKEAIESVLVQTFGDYEIVVINDCSTDHSVDVLEGYQAKDSRIRLLHNEKNSGAVFSVNRGIREARGEYIYLLAADDKILDPKFFENTVLPLEKHPEVPMSTTDHGCFLNGETKVHTHEVFPHFKELTLLSGKEFTRLCTEGQSKYWLYAMGTIFRRSLFFEYGFFRSDLPVLSDWYLIHMFALRFGCFYLPGTYVAWRHHGNNLHSNMESKEVVLLLNLIGKQWKVRRLFIRSGLLACFVKQGLKSIACRPHLWDYVLPFARRKLLNTIFFRRRLKIGSDS
ncbi:MAG: hypothetical protein SP1CHLAM54_15410 [Chlamydiia bacterium]|nr:hypothetical protein [Chlamydiia bacterium]MCH9616431.1 hypothetical protein [Chlamydiia bacterium]MCH9629583.1 hypothetical protein [Chlamydiia bacterium]